MGHSFADLSDEVTSTFLANEMATAIQEKAAAGSS